MNTEAVADDVDIEAVTAEEETSETDVPEVSGEENEGAEE